MVSEAVDSETKPFSGHLQDVHCIDIEGDLVATGSRDCAARVFDRSTGEARFILGTPIRAGPLNKITGKCQDPPVGNKNPGQGGHSMDVNSVCLSSSRGVLYTAGEGFGTRDFMKVWNLKTGELIQDMDGHMEGVFALTKAEELGLLFSASVDRTIRVWDMNTHKCLHVLEEHTDKVRCLYWNAERRELLSGGDELLVWNADDWTVKHKLEGHKDWVTSVCVDGEMVVSTSVDKTCRVWDFEGNLQRTLEHDAWLNTACVLDGQIITGCGNATIASWDLETWERKWSFMAHKECHAVSTVKPIGDGRLFTASWDGSIKCWTPDELSQEGAAAAEKEAAEAAAKPAVEAPKKEVNSANAYGSPLLTSQSWDEVEGSGPEEGIMEGILKDAAEADEMDEGQIHSDGFIKTASFAGVKPGMVFQRGPRGVGYYPDKSASNLPPVRNNAPVAQAEPEEEVTEEFITSGAKRSLIEELD